MTPDPMTPDPSHDRILIIDFGSQVTQLIARRIRESGVYCEITPFNLAEETFRDFDAKGVILSGGPASVAEMGTPRAPQARCQRRDHRTPARSCLRPVQLAPGSSCWAVERRG